MTAQSPKESSARRRVRRAERQPAAVPEISVVIVNYNVKEFLEQSLVSVEKALANIPAEVIVVDNASRDGSVELVRRNFSNVQLLAQTENLGFARSSNIGIECAKGRYVALLNPDTIVQEDTFAKMLDFMETHPETGLLGCKILNPDGTLQLACRRSFPTPWVAFTKLSGLSRIFSGSKLFGKYNLTYLDANATCEVDAISGSFMLIRRETLEHVGPLDEMFFMYGEDLDWCYRIRQSGWQVTYFPNTQIVHFKGESSKKAEFDSLKAFYKAMGLFAEKHFKNRYLLMPYWFLWLGIWLRAGMSFVANVLSTLAAPMTDLALLCLSIVAGVYLRFGRFDEAFLPVIVGYSVVWMLLLGAFGCSGKSKFSSSKAGLAIISGFLFNASLTFFFKEYAFSRAVVLYSSTIALMAIPGWRLLIKFLTSAGLVPFKGTLGKMLLARNTLVVGDMESGGKLIRRLNSQVDSGYDISGLVITNGRHIGEVVSGVRVLGSVDDLYPIIRERKIQEVIFATHQLSYDQILGIISQARDQRVNFKLIPSNLDVIIGKASIDRIDDMPLVEINYKLHQKRYRVMKRTFDVVLSFLILLATLPWIFYKKYVSSGRFESKMVIGVRSAVLLREFSGGGDSIFNKIPYLWSVLKGDISLVGSELRETKGGEVAGPETRLQLRPGLTGLVQVNRHKPLSVEDKEKYDIYYLKNYSPVLDIEILFKTLFKI